MSAVVLDVVVADVTSVQRNHSDWLICLFAEVRKFAKADLDLKRLAFALLLKIRIQNAQSAVPENVLCKIYFCKLKKKNKK